MSRYPKTLVPLIVLTVLVLSACGFAAPAPTQDPSVLYTQIAATVVANLAQTAAAASLTPAATETPLASPTAEASNTPLLSSTPLSGTPFVTLVTFTTPTDTPLFASTPGIGGLTPTLAVLPTLRPATQTSCDNFTFTDVNYPDGTIVKAGTNIIKTWEFTNTGPCIWN